MTVKRPSDGWEILKRNVDRAEAKMEASEAIAMIVAKHPEWAEQVPELKKHLKVVFRDESPNQ